MGAQAWVPLIVGGLAAVGVIVTWQQKNRADRRTEWWRRTAWAFERTFSDDDGEARLGWDMLATLLRSTLATKDDSDIGQMIAERTTVSDTGQEDEHGSRQTAGDPESPEAGA